MVAETYTFYAPCPAMDVEAMQTWLEDMSMEGYLLKGRSNGRHKYEFYKIEPLKTRYRLTPVSDKIEEWNLRPGEEFVSITEAYGWEYVSSNIRFHIFRAYNEDAREIHTDPVIQAQAIRQLGLRIVKTALIWLSLPLIFLLMLFVLGGANSFWHNLIIGRTGFYITMAFFMLLAMVKAVVELVPVCRLYIRVKQGYAAVNRKEWRKKAPIYRVVSYVCRVALVIVALMVVMGRAAYRDQAAYQELPTVGTDLPFLSVADMAQQSDIRSAERMEDVGYMRNWTHAFSPVNYDWAEIVEVVGNDGTEGLVSIQLCYHETKYLWLADKLAQGHLTAAKQTGTEMTEKPETNAEVAYFYYNEYGKPAAILKYGNCVISVEFPRSDFDIPTLTFEYWIETLDDTLSR